MPEESVQSETAARRTPTSVAGEEGASWNPVEEAILRRRSIRKFKRKQVPPNLIRRMLEAGRFAPSQGNCQPWKFVVVRDAEMLQAIEETCVERCKQISEGFDYATYPKGSFKHFTTRAKTKLANTLRPNRFHPIPARVVTDIARGEFAVFHNAPTVIFLLMDTHGVGRPQIDIGICGTNIVLAAQSYGLGTCWIGFAQLLEENREWRERLGADDRFEISQGIAVGYPIGDPSLNMVPRDTHEITWFEDGKKEVLF